MEPIFNVAVESIKNLNRKREIVHHTSTNHFLTPHAEKSEGRFKFVKKWAALEKWLVMVCAMVDLYSAEE